MSYMYKRKHSKQIEGCPFTLVFRLNSDNLANPTVLKLLF